MWLVVGLAGPVVAFYLLGVLGFVSMLVVGSDPIDEYDDAPEVQPDRSIFWIVALACAVSLGVADGALAGLLGGAMVRAALAGGVAGVVVSWPLERSLLGGFVSSWVIASVFAMNLVAMAWAL